MTHTTFLSSTIWKFAAFVIGLMMACHLMGGERIPYESATLVPNVFVANTTARESIPNVFYVATRRKSDQITDLPSPAPVCVDGVCLITEPATLSDNPRVEFPRFQARRLASFENSTQWSCPPVTVPAARTNNLVLPECAQCVSGPAPIWRNNNSMPAFRIRRRFRRK